MTIRKNYTTTIRMNTEELIRAGKMKKDAGDLRIYQDPGKRILVPHDADQSTIPGTNSRFDVNMTIPASDYHTGIAHYWPLLTDATDLIAASNGIATGSPKQVQGILDSAMYFEGSTNYYTLPASVGTELTAITGASIECWFRPGHTSLHSSVLFDAQRSDNSNHMLQARVLQDFSVEVSTAPSAASTPYALATAAGAITDREWAHIVVTVDTTNTTVRVYVNGALAIEDAVVAAFSGPFDGLALAPFIANTGAVTTQRAMGDLNSLALYHRALTADEVFSSYIRGLNKQQLSDPKPTWAVSMSGADNAGAEVADSVSGFNGVQSGALVTGTPMRVDEGFTFNGVDAQVQTTISSAKKSWIGLTGKMTIFGVFNWAGIVGGNYSVVGAYGVTSALREFVIRVKDAGTLGFEISDGTGANSVRVGTTSIVPSGKETHFAITYDNVQAALIDKVDIYIDGVKQAKTIETSAGTFTQMSDLSVNQWIGSISPWAGQFFDGSIRGIGILPIVVTGADVLDLYNRDKSGLRPDFTAAYMVNAISYWSLSNTGLGNGPQDLIGTNHTTTFGTISTNSDRPEGRDGQALRLFGNASPGYVFAADNPVFTAHTGLNGKMTLEANFLYSTPTANQTLLSKWANVSGGPETEFLFYVNIGKVFIYFHVPDQTDGVLWYTELYQLTVGKVYHVMMTFDNSKSTNPEKVAIAINGTIVPLSIALFGLQTGVVNMGSTTQPVRVGSYVATGNAPQSVFDGLIWDCAYYPEALSVSQMYDAYQKAAAPFNYAARAQRVYPTIGDAAKNDSSDPVTVWVNPSLPNAVHSSDFNALVQADEGADIGGDSVRSGDVRIGTQGFFDNGVSVNGGVIDFTDQILSTGDKSLLLRFRTLVGDGVLLADYDGNTSATSGSELAMVAGNLVFKHKESGVVLSTAAPVNDGQWHTAIITVANGGFADLFVDSDVAVTSAAITDTIAPVEKSRIGGYPVKTYVAPAGEMLRFEADSGVTLVDGKVSDWVGLPANTATQTTHANRPTFSPDAMAGKPAVYFQNGSWMSFTALDLTASDFTIFAVVKLNDTEAGGATTRTIVQRSVDTTGKLVLGNTIAEMTGETVSVVSSIAGVGYGVGATTPISLNAPHLVTAGLSGATTEDLRLDGTTQALNVSTAGGLDTGLGRSVAFDLLGGHSDGLQSLNGFVSAVLVFNTRLSVADTDYVERYLSNKYGVESPVLPGAVRMHVDIDAVKTWSRKLSPSDVTDMLGSGVKYAEPVGTTHKIRERVGSAGSNIAAFFFESFVADGIQWGTIVTPTTDFTTPTSTRTETFVADGIQWGTIVTPTTDFTTPTSTFADSFEAWA